MNTHRSISESRIDLEYNGIVFLCVFLSVTLVLSTTLILFVSPDQNDVYASSSHIGRAGDGYEAGRAAGVDDRQEDRERDSTCPPNNSLVWCGSYKVGYTAGWLSSGVVEATKDDNNNDDDDN